MYGMSLECWAIGCADGGGEVHGHGFGETRVERDAGNGGQWGEGVEGCRVDLGDGRGLIEKGEDQGVLDGYR